VPSNEALSSQRIKCLSECQIAKRNARLADALGINPEMRERVREVVYNDGLVAFAKANAKLLASVEKTFAEYASRIVIIPGSF
jgi:transcriptional repressor NF-X1